MPNKSIAKQKHENDKVVNFLSCSSTVWPPPHCVLHLNESVCCISKWCKRKSWGEEGLQIVGKLGLDPRPLSVTLTILLVCPIPSISYTFAQLILWDISRALPPVSPLPDIFHSCNSHHAYIYIESFTYLIQTLIALPSLHSPCILPMRFFVIPILRLLVSPYTPSLHKLKHTCVHTVKLIGKALTLPPPVVYGWPSATIIKKNNMHPHHHWETVQSC